MLYDKKNWILRVKKFIKKWDGNNSSHCTYCKKEINIGDKVIMLKNKKEKVYNLKFCNTGCFDNYEYEYLKNIGFYENEDNRENRQPKY